MFFGYLFVVGIVANGQISLPFGEAARFAAHAQGLKKCDHYANCFNPFAAMEAWRYVLNNANKAAKYATMRSEDHVHVEQELKVLGRALHEFSLHPNRQAFDEVTSAGHLLFEHYGDTLAQENSTVNWPSASGVGYIDGSRPTSVNVDSNGDIGDLTINLSNGVKMPLVALGFWQLTGAKCYETVRWALGVGYRHIVTTLAHGNEPEIGSAIEASEIPRDQIFITGKLSHFAPFFSKDYNQTVESQMSRLKIEYFDLYLLHTPGKNKIAMKEMWQFLEKLYKEKKVRAIGVSHFSREDIDELLTYAEIPPHVVQNKLSVYHPGELEISHTSMMKYLSDNGMVLLGSSLLSSWPLLLSAVEDPHVINIAERIQKTPALVLQRWALQMGAGFIMRTSNREHIIATNEVMQFQLSDENMRLLNGLVSLAGSVGSYFSPDFSEDIYSLRIKSHDEL